MRSSRRSSLRLLGFVAILVLTGARPTHAAPSELVLAPAAAIPLAAPARELRAFDVSGDGILDLVAVNPSAPGVQVLLGQGGGAFGAPLITPLAGIKVFDLGDVDGDGQPDLVTVFQHAGFSYALQAHLGDGAGGFLPAGSVDVSSPGGMYALKLLDVDEDGDLDAVVEQAGQLRVCRGDGAGGFAAPGPFVPGPLAPTQELHALDVDSDGHLDLVGSGNAFFFAGWIVYLGDGHGGFAWSQYENTSVDASLYTSAVGDFDGDHRTDLVLEQSDSECLCIQLAFAQGTGSGFAVPSPALFEPPVAFADLRAGDLDGDGLADVAGVFSSTLAVLPGGGDFTFDGPQLFAVAPPGTSLPELRLADVDGDERLDVLVLQEPGQVSLFLNESPPSGWTDLGHGLAGSDGIPSLLGVGELQPGAPGALKLTHANPSKLAALFIAPSAAPTSFKGGLLVPVPPSMIFMLGTSPSGTITVPWNSWPHLPVGTDYFFQFAIVDSAGPAGASLSNAVSATQP